MLPHGMPVQVFPSLALEGGGWSAPRPGRFLPTVTTLVQEAVWAYRSGRARIYFSTPGFYPQDLTSVTIRYTRLRYPGHHFPSYFLPKLRHFTYCRKIFTVLHLPISFKVVNAKNLPQFWEQILIPGRHIRAACIMIQGSFLY
jgi:hypothetical protein